MRIICPRDGCGRSVATAEHGADAVRVTARSRGHYLGRKPAATETTTELGPEPWRVVTGACRCGQYWILSHELIVAAASDGRRSLLALAVRPSTIHRRGNRRPLP